MVTDEEKENQDRVVQSGALKHGWPTGRLRASFSLFHLSWCLQTYSHPSVNECVTNVLTHSQAGPKLKSNIKWSLWKWDKMRQVHKLKIIFVD